MRVLITTIFITIMAAMLHAQQDPQFTQYMYNTMGFNPGYAGSQDMICINAVQRNQWMGNIEGKPITSLIHFNAPFKLFEKEHGAGLVVNRDEFGYNKSINFKGVYSYRMQVGEGKLGIGIGLGFYNAGFKPTESKGNPSGSSAPPTSSLMPSESTNTPFNMDLGVFYRTEKVYFGFSTTNILKPKIEFKSSGNSGSSGTSVISSSYLTRNYFITSGYTLQLSNPDFQLLPSFLILSDVNSTKLDLNSNIVYKNRYWGGLSYRVGSDVCFMFGLEFATGVKFTTSWDLPTSSVINYTKGSLEVSVSYSFKLNRERVPQRYKSIRFL